MSKRLTKALLRLCELEKKALETEVDFWKQEVILTNKAFKEIEETNRQLQDQVAKARFERDLDRVKIQGLAGQNEQLQSMATHAMAEDASLRDRISTAKFERDQARVELKALAEENERLRKNTGWVHIRNFDSSGPVREVLGVGETGRLWLFRVEGRNQFSAACDFGIWEIATSPVWVMEIPPINYDEEPAVGDA